MMGKEKALIVGGGGFVGFGLARELARHGYEVVAADTFSAWNAPEPLIQAIKAARQAELETVATLAVLDVRDIEAVRATMNREKPDLVVYLPALLAFASTANTRHAFATHVEGLRHVLDAVTETGTVRRVLFTSSSLVYGDFRYVPADEGHRRQPSDIYGRTKLIAEELLPLLLHGTSVEFSIARIAGVYGFGDIHIVAERLATSSLFHAATGRPFQVMNADNPIDFTHIFDVSQGLRLCLERPEAADGIFNITFGNARKIRDFVETVRRHAPDVEVSYLDEPPPADQRLAVRGTLDISKARDLLGFRPAYPIEEGIEATLNDYRRFLAGWEATF